MLAFNKTLIHRYYLATTGTDMKEEIYPTRKSAEAAMREYCVRHGIVIECSEFDKHERKYTNHKGVRFYINRI